MTPSPHYLDGTEYSGASPAACYADMGGTPAEIGTRFANRLRDLGMAFHATLLGGKPILDSVTTHGAGGGVVRVYYKHPAG